MQTPKSVARTVARLGALALAVSVSAYLIVDAQRDANPQSEAPELAPVDVESPASPASVTAVGDPAPEPSGLAPSEQVPPGPTSPFLFSSKSAAPASEGLLRPFVGPHPAGATGDPGQPGTKPVFLSTSKSLVIDPPESAPVLEPDTDG